MTDPGTERLREILDRHSLCLRPGNFCPDGIGEVLELIASERKDAARKERERCERIVQDEPTAYANWWKRTPAEIISAIRALPDEETP